MQPCTSVRWAEFLLLLLLATILCGHAQSVSATEGASTDDNKLCQRLRQDISLLLQQVYAETPYPVFLKEMLPDWIQAFLPDVCRKQRKDTASHSSKNGHIGRRRTTWPFRWNDFASSKQKNMLHVEKSINENRLVIPKENTVAGKNFTRKRRGTSAHELSYARVEDPLFRAKRFLVHGLFGGTVFWGMPLNRFNPGPTRPSTQLMDYSMRIMYPHTTTLINDNPASRNQGRGYMRGNTNLRTAAFGSAYLRNKREVSETKEDKSANMKRRTKRFLFGEAAEIQPMPSLFSIMMGTAQDPNTGKPIEFGGDIMKHMIVNSFTSQLPLLAQPPPGKEPNELVKIMAPVWYFSNMQQVMVPQSSRGTRTVNRRTYDRKQNQHGYYGDIVPGKRRKRSQQ